MIPLSVDDGACCWCGLGFTKKNSHMRATWDHLIPKSLGGSHEPENLRRAHRFCNSTRGNDDFETTRRIAIERPKRHRGGWATPAAQALRKRFKGEAA